MVRGDLADRSSALMEEVKGGADDPTESAGSRRRGLGKGLGAILTAHGRVDAHAAQRDELTGLPNRLLLDDRLEEALARCREDDASLAVLVVSLDNFATVNDLFGHRVGDHLLRATADRLLVARRKMDTVARFGGDEFVVVCPYVGSVELACLVADRILEDVGRPLVIEEAEHRLSASVGIVVVSPGGGRQTASESGGEAAGVETGSRPERHTTGLAGHPDDEVEDRAQEIEGSEWRGGQTVDAVLGDASLAMRHAKEQGGASWKLFEPAMREVADVRFQSRQDLHAAMEDGGLAVRYEPIVDLRTGALVGECAMPGWGQPESESEDPGDLLDLIDEAGLAAPICRWMLDEAMAELHQRDVRHGFPDGFRMWVKVAPSLSGDPALVEAVDEFTAKHGILPEVLGIDVREPQVAVMAAVEPVLQALEERDVAMAFDDFGMQPSNLALLPSLPVSRLKLSPELSALNDADDRALVRGLVDLGRALGLTVIAQGVMSDDQAAALRSLGCELAQGSFSLPAAPPEPLWASAPVAPATNAPAHTPVAAAPGSDALETDDPPPDPSAPSAPGARHLSTVRDAAAGPSPRVADDQHRAGLQALDRVQAAEQPTDEDVSGHPSYAWRDAPHATTDPGTRPAESRGLVGLPGPAVHGGDPVPGGATDGAPDQALDQTLDQGPDGGRDDRPEGPGGLFVV
jgi:diguanylate cyclase (GGDEF)-like protein